jgi:hypothetical protein
MGWRLSLRNPARLLLLLSASALTFFSKVALIQCDARGAAIQYPWAIACLQTIGLSLCVLPGACRFVAAAMRAGRAVIASLDLERCDPLDPTRHPTPLDYSRVAMFGTLRFIAGGLRLASLQHLHISNYLCLESLLFVFVSVASRFRRKNFFRYHTVGAVLGILGAALVCLSVALNVAYVEQPIPCSSPSDPSHPAATMPLVFGMACVALSQLLLAFLYCLEETFLSRVKIETQFFMGLQGVFGCFFMCLCCFVLLHTPADFSSDSSDLAALFKLGHEDVLQGFSSFVHSAPHLVCCITIISMSFLSVVSCIITTQHATATCRLVLELTKIVLLWAVGVYLATRSDLYSNWVLPSEIWRPQSVAVALGLLLAAIGQAVYHRCVLFPQGAKMQSIASSLAKHPP